MTYGKILQWNETEACCGYLLDGNFSTFEMFVDIVHVQFFTPVLFKHLNIYF